MEVLKKKLKFIMCRSVGDVEEKSHLTKSQTKPTHHHHIPKHQQDEGDKKQKKTKLKLKMMRKKVSPIPVPAGCFPVYVGPEENEIKQRFLVKAEMANHPLFQILLEDAESKLGLKRQGPIWLPCDVDLFYKVLAAMDVDMGMGMEDSTNQRSSFNLTVENEHAQAHASSSSPLASWNFIGGNRLRSKLGMKEDYKKMINRGNWYSLMNQSRLLKLNR